MRPNIKAILSATDIFDNLSAPQLELIMNICELFHYQSGDLLFREYEKTTELYVIGRGGVKIVMDPGVVGSEAEQKSVQPAILTELRQGQVLGEVALVDQGLRSATAIVSEDKTVLLRIPRTELMTLCNRYPELGYKIMRNLAADLALKIRHTDLSVRQYQLMLAKGIP